MLGDEMPEMNTKGPKSYGGSPVSFYVYVEKVDAAWKRARGCAHKGPVMPLADMFGATAPG
jgi:uncharacterized glyoxalase superfamily protein PhnB